MKLDPRIKKGKRPLTCLDVEQALEFVGKECIFSDFCLNYLDIEKFNIDNDNEHIGILSIDDNSSDYIFINTRNKSRYRFILPCEWVEDKTEKYRPYTLGEFIRAFDIGDVFKIRSKHTNYTAVLSYNGYSKSSIGTCIHLGADKFTLDELFKIYEIGEGCGPEETWHPFGIEDF